MEEEDGGLGAVEPGLEAGGVEAHVVVEQAVAGGEVAGVAMLVEPDAEVSEQVGFDALAAVGRRGMQAGDAHALDDGGVQVAREALEVPTGPKWVW